MSLIFMSTGITCRRGVYYFRARIPKHLVNAFGKPMVSLSLRTRDKDLAKRRARARRVELDNALSALQSAAPRPNEDLSGSVLFVDSSDVELICERYRVARLAEDEILRIKGFGPGQHELDLDLLQISLESNRSEYARGQLEGTRFYLDQYLRQLGLRVPQSSPSYERLARRFQQALIEVEEALVKRRQGVLVPVPIVASDKFAIADVLTAWKRQKGRNAKTVRSFEQAFELFQSHCRAPTATLIKKADVVAYRDAVIDRGEVSATTLAKQLGFLRAAFQCAVDDDRLPTNPFAGVKIAVEAKASSEKSRLPLTIDELQKVFTSPVYRAGYVPRKSLGDACYWIPLLGLFTGARLEELAQLEVQDIAHDPKHGHYFSIRRALDGSKRTKNLNSVRNFPVHPRLQEVGFLAFVTSKRAGRLFPELRPDKYGTLSTSFSTWWGLHLDKLGITDSTRVFHSFRHGFIQRGKEKAAKVPAEVREAIVGHLSSRQIEMVYGTQLYPLEPQVEAMRHIDWPELDLSHLSVAGANAFTAAGTSEG